MKFEQLTWRWEVLDSVHPVPLGVPGVPGPVAPPMGSPAAAPACPEHVTGVTGRSQVIDINNWTPGSVTWNCVSSSSLSCVTLCVTGLKITYYQQHYQQFINVKTVVLSLKMT